MRKSQRPEELYGGLRLHQNENTGGCSPRVLAALAGITPAQMCTYPSYAPATELCAAYLGVSPDRLSLVNGLDEGIMALAAGYLRPTTDGVVPEAIVPQPAFEVFAFDTNVMGGRVVAVAPRPDFSFAVEEVLAAITPQTRAVFVANPNNPTGATVPLEAIRTLARAVPAGAVVFVDEAYNDFGGDSFIPELPAFPNVIVGRTFSKAFGLAGIRIGAITGDPDTLEPLRQAIPTYSVNIAALVALRAALSDLAFVEDYLRQTEESKRLLYAACDRLGLRYWKSAANFVLISVGDQVDALVTEASDRGVHVRDRSSEAGCRGCVRVTAGIVEHTRKAIGIMEEVLCAVP